MSGTSCRTFHLGIILPDDEDTDELYEILNEYLEQFAPPEMLKGRFVCQCGHLLLGFGGSYTKRLEAGEGRCASCFQSIRLVHSILDRDGLEIVSFELPLLYKV